MNLLMNLAHLDKSDIEFLLSLFGIDFLKALGIKI
jgi:hypothetical protein